MARIHETAIVDKRAEIAADDVEKAGIALDVHLQRMGACERVRRHYQSLALNQA
jgi:hypothetical protein